jgi:hypothetical protein
MTLLCGVRNVFVTDIGTHSGKAKPKMPNYRRLTLAGRPSRLAPMPTQPRHARRAA